MYLETFLSLPAITRSMTELDKFVAAISANPAKTCIRISADASNNNVKLYLKSTLYPRTELFRDKDKLRRRLSIGIPGFIRRRISPSICRCHTLPMSIPSFIFVRLQKQHI